MRLPSRRAMGNESMSRVIGETVTEDDLGKESPEEAKASGTGVGVVAQ